MATGMEAVIELPLRRRTRGLLIDTADRIPNSTRWTAGVTLRPWGCSGLIPTDADYCDFDSDELDEFFAVGNNPIFDAFDIYNTESCSTLDSDITVLNDRVERRWEVMVSEQVATRLNVELAYRATVVTTGPVNTSILIAKAEEALALTLHGGLGMVHLSPAALSMVVAEGSVDLRGDQWRTPGGHLVVADAGHSGIQPDGEVLLAGTEWVYTTGAVLYGLGEPRIPTKATEYLDRSTNTNTARAIGTSVVAFDPCSASAIEYGFPDYTEGS
jgi:hypothetical protein